MVESRLAAPYVELPALEVMVSDFLWVGTVIILARCTVKYQEDEEHDGADEWNECDQDPPSGTASVMQPADCHSETGDEHGERVDAAQDSVAGLYIEGSKNGI